MVWDQPGLEAVGAGAAKEWQEVARFLSRYGDFPFLLAAGVVALAVSLCLRAASWSRILTAMILAGIIAGLASNLIKLGTGRVRPRVEQVAHGWYGPKHGDQWVSLRHDFQSFPSSHAACAFGFSGRSFSPAGGWVRRACSLPRRLLGRGCNSTPTMFPMWPRGLCSGCWRGGLSGGGSSPAGACRGGWGNKTSGPPRATARRSDELVD